MARGGLFNLFMFVNRDSSRYRKIRNDDRLRQTSTSCGVRGILHAVLGVGFSIGFLLLGYLLAQGENALGLILGVIIMIASAAGALMSFVRGLINSIFQTKLVRKGTGYAGLILSLLMLAGFAAGFIITLGSSL